MARRACALGMFGRAVLWTLLAGGCMGRGMTVRDPRVGDLSQIRGQAVQEIYLVPFSLSGVELKGDHGDDKERETNKAKWFTHVVVGAQQAFNDKGPRTRVVCVKAGKSVYDREIFAKTEISVDVREPAPPDALVVSGRYLFSENISGASRAFLGMMSGKSWTRAAISIARGGREVYGCVLDGKYLGGGWSWGYETLGANEGLGRGIAEIIRKLRKGEKIETE